MTVTITLTTAPGSIARYNLYSDTDGYVNPFATNVLRRYMVDGYTSSVVPDGSFNIKVLPWSGASCTAGVIIPIQNIPTPTPTVTQTQTPSPTAIFNPTYVADLFQWFDASFPSNIQTRIQTGSTYVTQWNARYGNSVSQSNTSLQPRYVESSYSFPYSGVQFDTITQILTGTTSGTTPSGNTTFIVSYVPGTTQVLTWSLDTNNGEGISSLYVGSNKGEARSVGSLASLDPITNATYYPKMLTFVSGNSSSVGATFDDVPNNGSRTFTAGSTMTGMKMGFSGNTNAGMAIYEIIVYNRVLNTTEKDNIINYLKTKWEYSNWGATPTPTKTPTQTATPTMTLTNTLTQTTTNTPTPSITASQTATPSPVYYYYQLDWVAPGGNCASPNLGNFRTPQTFAGTSWFCGTYNGVPGYKFRYVATISSGSYTTAVKSGNSGANCSALTC